MVGDTAPDVTVADDSLLQRVRTRRDQVHPAEGSGALQFAPHDVPLQLAFVRRGRPRDVDARSVVPRVIDGSDLCRRPRFRERGPASEEAGSDQHAHQCGLLHPALLLNQLDVRPRHTDEVA
ncbi:MAG: hypothetical protein DMF89_04745 [Acidobacteria bacterium]|nr:MAG: hypothetical protein DMF89_04745 [Acidobacteriota bacterium]